MAVHAMIDIETLDTSPQSVVLSVGAVKFNPYDETEPYNEIYYKLDLDDQDRLHRTTSDSTIEWWSKQNEDVRNEAFSEDGRIGVDQFLNELRSWLSNVHTIWGHGYGFDLTILEDMYKGSGKSIPWNFWQVKDSRTLFSLCKKDPRKLLGNENLHNALADAYFQAKGVQMAFNELSVTRA